MPKCQLFSFSDGLTEMVPGALAMRSLVGDTISIGILKFTAPAAHDLPQKAHAHGEEATLQITGGCTVFQGIEGSPPKHVVNLSAGTAMFMPADEMHYGANKYDEHGVCLRLNVVTPPRADYGRKDAATIAYHAVPT